MASHTNTGPARSELTTVITIDDALILFQPGAQHPGRSGCGEMWSADRPSSATADALSSTKPDVLRLVEVVGPVGRPVVLGRV